MEKRASNFEALRIFAILMIMLHHFCVHNFWGNQNLSRNMLIMNLSIGGKIGVDLFILITGWFMISGKFKIRSLLRVVLETGFYCLLILGLTWLIKPDQVDPDSVIYEIFPLIYGEPWFVSAYVSLYIFIPFLNFLALHLSQKAYQSLLIVALSLFSVLYTFTAAYTFYSNLSLFILLYLLAGYFHLYQFNGSSKKALAGIVIFTGCAWGWVRFYFRIIQYHSIPDPLTDFNNPNFLMRSASLVSIMIALCWFFVFKNWKCSYHAWINKIGGTAFGIYLIHDNILVRKWIWTRFNDFYSFPIWKFILGMLVVIAAYFIAFSLVDLLRQYTIEKPFFRFLEQHYSWALNSVDRFMNRPLEIESTQLDGSSQKSFSSFVKQVCKKSLLAGMGFALLLGCCTWGYFQLFRIPAWRSGLHRANTIRISFIIDQREDVENKENLPFQRMTSDDWMKKYRDQNHLAQVQKMLQAEGENDFDLTDFNKYGPHIDSFAAEDGKIFLSIVNYPDKEVGKKLLNEILDAYNTVFAAEYPLDYLHIQSDSAAMDSYWVSNIPHPAQKERTAEAVLLGFWMAFSLIGLFGITDSKYKNFQSAA